MGIFSRKTTKIEEPDSVLSNDNFDATDDTDSGDMLDNISSLSVDDLQLSEDAEIAPFDLDLRSADKSEPGSDLEDKIDFEDRRKPETTDAEPEAVALDSLEDDADDVSDDTDATDTTASVLDVDDKLDNLDDDLSLADEAIFEPADLKIESAAEVESETVSETPDVEDLTATSEIETDVEEVAQYASLADIEKDLDSIEPAAALQAIVPRQTNRISHELTNFVEGFDEVANDYEVLSGLIAKAASRNAAMQKYASSLRTEAARNSLISEELEKAVAENDRINGIIAVQNAKIMHLETDLESISKLKAGLKEELTEALGKYEQTQDSLRRALEETKRAQNEAENFEITIGENNKIIDKLDHELQQTREVKASTEAKLVESRKELSDLTFSSSELSMQHEKLSKLQKKMLVEHEKLAEEHRSLHREYGLMQTKIADMEIRNERLKAENQDVAGRLASEKFSMKKDHDALNSELSIFRKQNAGLAFENKNLLERLRVAEADRKKAKDSLEDLTRSLSHGRKELSSANLSISELNLKYSADLLTLDQLRDENRELRARVESLQSEKMKLTDYESQAKIASDRAEKLEAKLAEYADGLSLVDSDDGSSERKSEKSEKSAEVIEAPTSPTASYPKRAKG